MLELVVAVRMRGAGTLLVVDAQRESHLLEKPGDGPRADAGAELAQFGGDLGGRTACPLQAADRVAGRLVVHQRFDVGDDFRRFFSVGRRPPPARRHPVELDVALDELAPAGGDRRRVDAEQSGDAPVTAPPALERFEAGKQAPLPLVEQAGEQHDRGAQFLRHQVGLWQGPHESGRGQQQAPRAQLVGLVRAVGRAVEELAGELVPRQPPVADELAQRVLGADREQVVQLVDEVSRLGVVDERLGGRDQGAGAGEADPGEGPQAVLVEVGECVEGVVAAAMRVAGPGVEVLELAKRGAPAGAGTEGRHHLGQRGDGLLAEQGDDRVGGELGWSHYGTIADTDFRNYAIIWTGLCSRNPENICLAGLFDATTVAGPGVLYSETTGTSRKLFCADP